ncbi:MAG: hypothetical protein OHK93_003796 [Ramalina farinacea]|uniref:Uncharacterized protein n=1 Tax=Ramalina farinacea TaxID=258253 RepID=A0AA43QU91_9LECA|nr:hypothetical protein [Ramalina farinacea]
MGAHSSGRWYILDISAFLGSLAKWGNDDNSLLYSDSSSITLDIQALDSCTKAHDHGTPLYQTLVYALMDTPLHTCDIPGFTGINNLASIAPWPTIRIPTLVCASSVFLFQPTTSPIHCVQLPFNVFAMGVPQLSTAKYISQTFLSISVPSFSTPAVTFCNAPFCGSTIENSAESSWQMRASDRYPYSPSKDDGHGNVNGTVEFANQTRASRGQPLRHLESTFPGG